MNWIIISHENTYLGSKLRIEGKNHEHILHILKKKQNDLIRAIIPNTGRAQCRVLEIGNLYTEVVIENVEHSINTHPFLKTEVYFALPRPQTGKKIFHLSGVYGIGNLHFISPHNRNKEYWTSPLYNGAELTEIYEGMSQSGNPFPAIITYSPKLGGLSEKVENENSFFVLDPNGAPLANFESIIRKSWNEKIYPKFLFGPESGWTDGELELFKNRGFRIVKLSSVILRTEYAYHAFLHQTNAWSEAEAARD